MNFSNLKKLTQPDNVDVENQKIDSVQVDDEQKNNITSLILTTSITFLMGAYHVFCLLKEQEILEFTEHINTYNDERDENNSVHNFISWYLNKK